MKRFGLLAAAALTLAGFASPAQATLVIDSFSDGALTLINSGAATTTVNSNQSGLSNVIGGTRNLDLTVNVNGQVGITRAIDTVNTTTQRFAISNDEGVDSTSVLTYAGSSASGLGGANLTAFGTGIAFDVVSIDQSVSITIDLIGANATSTLTKTNLTAGTVVFAFANFSAPAVAGAVNIIKVTFNTPTATDLSGSFLRVTNGVPEPSTVAALASGALFMGGFALRRRRAAKA